MTKVSEIMNNRPTTVPPSMPIIDVARKMRDHRAEVIFVCENGKLRGKTSEQDIVAHIASSAKDLRKQPAGSIMSEKGPQISAGADLMEAAKLMARHRVRHLPVVQNARLMGILTLERLAGESLAAASLVIDWMRYSGKAQSESVLQS